MLIAQNLKTIQSVGLPGFNGGGNLGDFINKSGVLTYVFGAAGILLLIYLVLGGLQMMTSKGDPKAMQGAQSKITNALLGFVIVIIAFVIVQLFGKLLGLNNFI